MVYFYLVQEIDITLNFYKHLSKTKRCMAVRIFHIFEPLGIEQIGRTTGLSTRKIYRELINEQVLQLRRESQRISTELETFAGEDLLTSYLPQEPQQAVPQYDVAQTQQATANDDGRRRTTECDDERRQATADDDGHRGTTTVDDAWWDNDLFSI
jgi:hypothetical protein